MSNMMNRVKEHNDFLKFHNEKIIELPLEIRQKAVEYLKSEMPKENFDNLILLYRNAIQKGYWFTGYHFGYGMAIRNFLRAKGLFDDQLPSGNWDDYYVCCLEIAMGVRGMDGETITIEEG